MLNGQNVCVCRYIGTFWRNWGWTKGWGYLKWRFAIDVTSIWWYCFAGNVFELCWEINSCDISREIRTSLLRAHPPADKTGQVKEAYWQFLLGSTYRIVYTFRHTYLSLSRCDFLRPSASSNLYSAVARAVGFTYIVCIRGAANRMHG